MDMSCTFLFSLLNINQYISQYRKMNRNRNIVLTEAFRHCVAATGVLTGLNWSTETLKEELRCPSSVDGEDSDLGRSHSAHLYAFHQNLITFCRRLSELLCSQGGPDKQTDGISRLRP